MCASPAFGEGLWMRSAAAIQPARLARGMRRVLLERGVRIHEGTRVRSLSAGSGRLQLATDGGRVFADQVVLAINAWASGWPGFRSRLLAWGSYMVATEPIPERLAELGLDRWRAAERLALHDQLLPDHRRRSDRVRRRVGAAGYDGRIGPTFTHDQHAIARVAANFRHLLPMLADVRLEDAWGGPIDITGHRFPEIGSTHDGRMHFAHGFAGNGAGPSRLAGRILATLVDGAEPSLAALPFVGRRQPFLPPEPFRYIGARVVREALIREDDALDAGRRPAWLLQLVARIPRLFGYRLGH